MVFTMHVYILGGSKNNFIFSKKVEKLQEFVTHLFMGPFEKLEKIFNLNRSFDMWLIDKVFHIVGHKDRKQYLQCPNAEFAKKYNLMHVLPLFCNADYWGISQLHGTLIRQGTCGNCDKCDYCIVGSKNPMAKKYEIVKDENGFLVSQKI